MLSSPILVAVCVAVTAFFLSRRRSKRLPLPPGPKGLPIIGNLLNAPTDQQWLTFEEWGRQYGSDILYYHVFGTPTVVINSTDAANDLLEKRSAIYSDRPSRPMLDLNVILMGFSYDFGMMRYGDAWKERRKLFHKMFFSTTGFPRQAIEQRATRRLLRRLLEKPDNRTVHLRHFAAYITVLVAYGIEIQPEDDPYVEIAEKALLSASPAGIEGSYLIDYLHFLKYVPEWVPGAGFQGRARETRKYATSLVDVPFESLTAAYANGTAVDSVGRRLLEELAAKNSSSTDRTHQERVIKDVLVIMYAGGADVTVSTFNSFFLAMVQNPDIQRKAQGCVDSLISVNADGRHFPDFSDRSNNNAGGWPYIEALLKEVLRWQPVALISDPHCVMEEDTYKGYRIPAGSIVVGNIWTMLHDERVYSDPYVFDPERWLKDGKLNCDIPDPSAAFGFGRRVCPGQSLAKSTLWLVIVSVLASFDIEKAMDENGVQIDVPTEYSTGIIRHPKPFRCTIKPRNKEVEALIKSESPA